MTKDEIRAHAQAWADGYADLSEEEREHYANHYADSTEGIPLIHMPDHSTVMPDWRSNCLAKLRGKTPAQEYAEALKAEDRLVFISVS